MKQYLLLMAVCLFTIAGISQTTIISYNSSWKYLDDGSNQGTAWKETSFNDASWASGLAEFGYGDGDEATIVSYGSNSRKKYITTYFRKTVNVSNPSSYANFILNLRRDDGAVVYVNGVEVHRNNMPTGAISSTTKASATAADDGNMVQSIDLLPSTFVNGNNVIAVEIHQVSANDDDISFDLQLLASNTTSNLPPVAHAGVDQTISLPTSTVALDGSTSADPDGNIISYAWTKISGPSGETIGSPANPMTAISGLVQGVYIFRLTVTDNNNATGIDDVQVTVNPAASSGGYTVIPYGAIWKYLDDGSDQGIAWQSAGYNDVSWSSGPAELGYGDGDEATVVSYGTNTKKKYITTYFRKLVSISNPFTYGNFTLNLKRDDGAIVHINGNEVFSTNMPTGAVNYLTKASAAATDDGSVAQTVTIPTSAFVAGSNIIAVEIHQNNGNDADISFDLELIANDPLPNQPPVANAGNDQTITLPANSVSLSGSGSSDPDGTINAYAWSKLSGPSATITNPSSVNTSVTGLVQGVYLFRLTVTDNNGATAFDDVQVTVNAAANQPPVANAGVDQTITLPTNSVSVSGSGSSDPDGTISGYAWTKVSGPASFTIVNPSSVTTSITGLTAGVYIFRLTVTDNNSATAFDDIQVNVNSANQPPVANAGVDQTITLPTNNVALNGSSSSDPDGTITTYSWTKISGPSSFTIVSPSSVNTNINGLVEGSYTFRLTVTDNNGATSFDDVVVTVNPEPVISTYNVISYGNVWKYLDNGSDQGTAWRGTSFNDGAWDSGPGQLGYGDNDEATVLSYGGNSGAKYITSYFRKTVNINNPSAYASFRLNVKRDDGIVVYVNGTEVFRDNMPTGSILYNTAASTACSDDGNGIQSTTIASSAFVNGNNTIAVEIHQSSGTSSDISFDMELIATAPGSAILTRGPYLQMGNGSAVTLRWRTDNATNSRLAVGTSVGTYPIVVNDATVTTEHEIRVTGLTADTKYYYSFGSSSQTLQAASSNYFTTAPAANTTRKIRIAAYGDCGRNDNGFQAGTLSAYQSQTGSNPAEIMLLLGDNAYDAGTDAEYQSNFFNAYSSSILKNHVLFPAPGNHDYANNSTRQNDHNVPYYNIFTMPTNAECGGVPSGTEAFYSYNWGNIHFLSLDSYGRENNSTRLYDTAGPQVTWIKQDLTANTRKWVVAYWHHPPYTKGSHNSDTESDLINIRQNFIRILERYGVDMIICGHSHDYERSYLLKDHFGTEATFNLATHAVSSSSAKYDGSSNSCPYQTVSGQVNHGTVYIVAGSAGADGGVQSGYPHDAFPFSQDDGGMLYFEVEDNRLDAKFIRKDNVIADKFTILKDANKTNTVTINSGEQAVLTASWIGNYSWNTGATTRSITVSPSTTTNYTVTDGTTGCISDQFTVNVNAPIANRTPAGSAKQSISEFNAYPTPVKRGTNITITGKGSFELMVINEKGQQVKQLKVKERAVMTTADMPSGMYFIRDKSAGKNTVRKIIITD